LAKHVLEGRTKGYRNHPQLDRFKKAKYPLDLINQYLSEVYHEALKRNFNFDMQKIDWTFRKSKIPLTTGQLKYETEHLLGKLKKRDPNKYETFKPKKKIDAHPVFRIVLGPVEEWEIIERRPLGYGKLIKSGTR